MMTIDKDSFTQYSKLQPADLCKLKDENKEGVDQFMIHCIKDPKSFFNYVSTLDLASIRVFRQMLVLPEMWPSLERIDNEEFLQACDDERLLQYAVMTHDVTRIPLERLNKWLTDKFPDNSDETIQKIADIPFALNLTIIALIQQNPFDKKIKNLLGKRSNSPQPQQNFLNLTGATFLYWVKLRGANLKGANLSGADLSGANLRGANLEGANLEGANLEGANLEGANLRGADLSGANLEGANLFEANLRGADLSGANLRGANLYWADLGGANLERANLSGANLTGANLTGANLSGANLRGANLSWATLCGAILTGANLSRANLREANLEGANLFLANLSGANLYWADLSGANLEMANLSGAILIGANLAGVCLQNTLFDKTTQFSFNNQNKLPHFISKNISTPDALVASLKQLLEKTKDHPQREEIKQCVVEEIKKLLKRNCSNDEEKESWCEVARDYGFILSLKNPVENITTSTTTSTVSNFFVSPLSSSSSSSSSPPAAHLSAR